MLLVDCMLYESPEIASAQPLADRAALELYGMNLAPLQTNSQKAGQTISRRIL
jgi:hypothetical protein